MSIVAKRTTAVPKFITVQVDTRERYPIPFPSNIRITDPDKPARIRLISVKTERIKLDIGDYRLKEFPGICVIERKGSPMELAKNLFDPQDQLRSAKAFRRLSAVEYPYLLLETTPFHLMNPKEPAQYSPDALMHRLSLVIAKYGLNVMWAPKSSSTAVRRSVGLMLLHLMFGYAIREIADVPLDVVPDGRSSHE